MCKKAPLRPKIIPSKTGQVHQRRVSYRLQFLPDRTCTWGKWWMLFFFSLLNYRELHVCCWMDEEGFIVKHLDCHKIKCSVRLCVHHLAIFPLSKDKSDSPVRTFWGLEHWKMPLTLPSLAEGIDIQAAR